MCEFGFVARLGPRDDPSGFLTVRFRVDSFLMVSGELEERKVPCGERWHRSSLF